MGLSIILETDHMLYLQVVRLFNFNKKTIAVEHKERIYTLLPKVTGNYFFFFPKLLVLSAFSLLLYRILSLQQLEGEF